MGSDDRRVGTESRSRCAPDPNAVDFAPLPALDRLTLDITSRYPPSGLGL